MKKVRALWASGLISGLLFVVLALNISGCGAVGSSSPTPTGNVSIALTQAPPSTLAAGGTAAISATVTNDSSNAGVDWSCAPASTCGSFSPAHTASGAMTTYTAPSAATSVTITAASTSTHTATAVATVTVTGGTVVSISITTAPPATLSVNGTASIAATVSNDTANAGVDWTCTPTGTCGTFNPAHTASGAATTYTAPGAAVAAVITATSTTSHSATATSNVSVTAATSTTIPAGTYSFYVSGEDSKKNTYAIAGAVVINASGVVTGGEQDYVSDGGATSPQPSGDTITGGTLTIGANSLGTLTMITNNGNVGVAGTETFSFSKVNSKHALIGEFDAGATSSGSFDLETLSSTTVAALSGPFVFTVSGKNASSQEVFGGLMSADGAGNLTVSELDFNEGGSASRGHTNSTTYTAPDAAGRGTFAFGGNHFVYYMVTAKVLRIVVTDVGEPDVGSAYAGVSGVSNASIGTSFVFTDTSNLSSGATFAAAGKLTLDGNGNVTSGFADVDEGGTVTSAAVTGTYTVNANGYGEITLTPGNTQDISVLGLYLADPTINPTDPNSAADAGLSGLVMDLDTKVPGTGWLILPAAGTPTFTGSFSTGAQASASNSELDSVGIAAVSGTTFTGTVDLNDVFNTGLGTAVSISGTLTADGTHAGRYTIPVLVSLTAPPTDKYVIYQASSTQFFTIEVDTNQFASGTLQKQQ